jgi:hypothetical protein
MFDIPRHHASWQFKKKKSSKHWNKESRINAGIRRWKLHLTESTWCHKSMVVSVLRTRDEQLLHKPVQDFAISNQSLNALFSSASPGVTVPNLSREYARDNILSPHFGSRRIAARRPPFYRCILKDSERGLGVAPRVYAECNSVLHFLAPRILHSAWGPYIALMPTCED